MDDSNDDFGKVLAALKWQDDDRGGVGGSRQGQRQGQSALVRSEEVVEGAIVVGRRRRSQRALGVPQ